MSRIILIIIALLSFKSYGEIPTSGETCTGRFPNPITDICWSCIFPITIGSAKIVAGKQPDSPNPSSPVCYCPLPYPPYIRVGINIGFWEPVRMVDVTRKPGCMVNLGGKQIDIGLNNGQGRTRGGDSAYAGATYQAHWYVYPLTYLLNIIIDSTCKDSQGFDLAYMTEVDPLWMDDELTFLINPEGTLFANPVAQAVCAADCVSSTLGLPLDPLFWCSGCRGSVYPLDGNIDAHHGGVDSSLLTAERMIYKLHRQGILWGSMGDAGLCGSYPMPVWRKSQYRTQMLFPIPSTGGPFGCNPIGRSSVLYETAKEFPVKGEHFGWLIWRKRNCCASAW
ncbi:TPA: conjugal transfer pilus assembly protein TraU [Aeromonas hydrophila]|nr:conjugal transfer pilus assembly protein TraU [Aeromonas hydrophila]